MGGSSFSTWACYKNRTLISADANMIKFKSPFADCNCSNYSKAAVSWMFLRHFSAEAPAASEQMNLIKRLRERTSAPIKDVKSALIEANWDIGKSPKRVVEIFCLA